MSISALFDVMEEKRMYFFPSHLYCPVSKILLPTNGAKIGHIPVSNKVSLHMDDTLKYIFKMRQI